MKKQKTLLFVAIIMTHLMSCATKNDENQFQGPSNRYLIEKHDKYGYIDKFGNVVITPQFEIARHFREGLAKVGSSSDGPFGYIDTCGNLVIQMEFDEAEPFSEGYAQIKIGDNWGFINRKGKIVVSPQYEETFPFSEGVAAVKVRNGKWGFVNCRGEYVIPPQYSSVGSFSEGLASADGGYISKDGKYKIKSQYIESYMFKEGRALVSYPELSTRQLAIIDTDGNIINMVNKGPLQTSFSEGRITIEGANGKGKGYADRNGNPTIMPNYDLACNFHDGLARVCIDKKWGYIDTMGTIVIYPKYNYASDFREGLALVSLYDNTYKYINTKGIVVYEFINFNPYFGAIYSLSLAKPLYDMSL